MDKTDIDNLAKSVELKPRQGTGLFGMAKRRTERMADKANGCTSWWIFTSTVAVMMNKINHSNVQAVIATITMVVKPLVSTKALKSLILEFEIKKRY